MKIKNIQEYRSFYKNEIRDLPTRDENFIGNFLIEKETGKKKFGWFEIYHGDKEGYGKAEAGIENFLQSFLDMAKDGQAVYEFLQNAVDAGSTHYSMVWGGDEVDGNHYLLVANNGKMFNLDSIRSILNVGSSTKTNDSHTIGKFGIGFKLAHRLVGKDNGLQELINENSGPILFSWRNYEIEQLANAENIEPQALQYAPKENSNYEVQDEYPWLFKILITCFPCLPQNNAIEELPKMADGVQATANPFSHTEYEVLSRWVKKNQHILNKETYNEGALFFIKLGSGKEEELAEENLKEGVKFAIAILKETAPEEERASKLLQTVQLNNDDSITYPDLEYIKITIDKEEHKDTYAHIRFGVESFDELTDEQIRRIVGESNIEVLFGFRKHNEIDDFFKGAPNLYLYFPLSEEVHNFNYILHSNAFYKGSSRTFLHKGNSKEDGINERLLKVIVSRIENRLIQFCGSDKPSDKSLLLHFYAALLTSGKSTNNDRLWIETPYINPINKLLGKYIPVRDVLEPAGYSIINDANKVFIKRTNIGIDASRWGLTDVHWFYWNLEDEAIIEKGIEKLGIKEYTIFNLLKNIGIDNHINTWLKGEYDKIKLVLTELSAFEGNAALINEIRPQLIKLKLFRFSNGDLLSLSEFLEKEKDGYFLLHNTLGAVKDILIKAGLITTAIDLNEYKFVDIFRTYLLQASKHKGYTELTQLFSLCVKEENLATLSRLEKLELFNAFRTLNSDSVTERIKELKLFNNNLGKPVAFKSLLVSQPDSWLNTFSIAASELDEQLKGFLLDDRKEIYENIIYPFWNALLAYISRNSSRANEIIFEIAALYNESTWVAKQQYFLSNQDLIIYQSEVLESDNIFFNKALCSLPDEVFGRVQTICFKFYGLYIPDKYLINYLEVTPLSYSSSSIDAAIEHTVISIDDINDIMLLCSKCNIDFFEANSIILKDNQYIVDSTSGLKQFNTSKPGIVSYIAKYHPGQFALIPDGVNTEAGKIKLTDSALVVHLIELFTEHSMEQELDLIELVIKEGDDIEKSLLNKLTFIRLDASWVELRQNQLYLKLLSDILTDTLTPEELFGIQDKLLIYENDVEIIIGSIDSARDSIEVKRDDKTIYLSQSRILNLENADTIKLVQGFHDGALNRELINPAKADKLFKISKVGLSKDLVTKFETNLRELNILKDALPLSNAHQLSFVLLSGQYTGDNLKQFAVKCQDDKWYYLKGTKIIYSDNNAKFITPSLLLSQCYNELESVVSIGDLDVFNFGQDENDIITSRFLFVKGCAPDILESTAPINDKLNYLFNGWVHLNPQLRVTKRTAAWENYLGIIPNQFVLDGIHLKEEILPAEFLDWCQTDKRKKDFLGAIGVFVGDSPIEKLRQFLTRKLKEQPQDIEIERFNETILLNTVDGLSGTFENLDGQPVIYAEKQQYTQLSLIDRIINHLLEKGANEYPEIIYYTNDTFKVLTSQEPAVYIIDESLHQKIKLDPNNRLNQLYHEYNVRKRPYLLNTEIVENCDALVFEKNFVPSGIRREHDEPFYHSWKVDNQVGLFREPEIKYDMSIEMNGEMITVARISDGVLNVSEDIDGFQHVFYKESISLEELKQALSETHKDIADAVADLISRRNSLLASIYNTLNAAGRNDIKSDSLKAFEAALKDENLKQERKDLIETINENTDYSYTWFESYLKFLLTYESKQSTTVQKSISFQEIRRYIINDQISDKYFLLCGASSLIPLNIEDFEDFKITLFIKNSQNEVIKVEGVSKKGQDLLIYCREKIPDSIIDKFSDIIQVKVSFSPIIDLLERLYRAFTNRRNIDEWDDINEILPHLQFIYGPPGTGKTTTLCSMIADGVKEHYNAKFLLLTPTNKAADVLCKKIVKSSATPGDVVGKKIKELDAAGKTILITRVGKPTDPELEDLEVGVYQESVTTERLDYTNILASTIHRIPYFEIIDEDGNQTKIFSMQDYWDYIVFDEASMINLPYIVFAILALHKFNPNAKFIIAGDPKQIPPVVDVNDKDLEELDIQDENIYTMMEINSFNKKEQKLRAGDSILNLERQYRSVKQIGQLFSDLSYNDLLKHHREEHNSSAKPLPEDFKKLINKNVTFIDIPLDRENSIFRIDKLLYSSYHIYSAIFVAELVKYLDTLLPDGASWSIGLIAPYKAQAILLNKLITSYAISEKLVIYSDTVHGFQGDECDMVFFISNPNNYYYTGHEKCLLSKEYIYNVAVSRAKDYLIILHPYAAIKDNKHINSICASYLKHIEKTSIRKSEEFEKIMFNQKDFIEKSSYITGHDNVNVFGQIEMKYFIKANESAIDIQLRKL